MRRILGALLAFLIAQSPAQSQGTADSGTIKEQVSHIAAASFIEVKLRDKTKLAGFLGAVEADTFTVRMDNSAGTLRQAAFADVMSVKVVPRPHTSIAVWIASGAVAAVVVIAVVVYFILRHNE